MIRQLLCYKALLLCWPSLSLRVSRVAQDGTGVMVCGFSEHGTFIFAGSNDCCVYVWNWELEAEHWQKSGSDAPASSNGDNKLSDNLSLVPQGEDSTGYANVFNVWSLHGDMWRVMCHQSALSSLLYILSIQMARSPCLVSTGARGPLLLEGI